MAPPDVSDKSSPGPITRAKSSRGELLLKCVFAVCGLCILIGCGLLVLAEANSRKQPTGRGADADQTTGPTPPDRSPSDGGSLAAKAQRILKANCYRCHGENGAAEGGFNYVLDRDRLVARRKLLPGDADHSKVYRRIREGEMPPEDEKPRPGSEDLAVLKQWIEAGAPAAQPEAPRTGQATPADIVARIHADLQTLPERDRRFARYFTITHLHNAGLSDDELQTYRNALAKLVNSLSWHKEIVKPQAVDPTRTIFRIDLRDYQWSDRVWKRILDAYPHGVLQDTPAARECYAAGGRELSHVRADWFVAAASRPPLYHELLQLPDTERKLEEQLHIDVAEDVRQERVARAGFNGSGVSRNNRLIERHESPYGSYWRSYDFADNLGRRNLFAHPLGAGRDGNAAQPDGGEIIFSLPNGLNAFMLVNAQGKRLDKAPAAIVSDPRRPDRAVENGVSCMACHARGLIPKDDQVRSHVERNPNAFSPEETASVLALYPPESTLKALFAKDNDRFRKAVEKTGSRLTTTEPIAALVLQYEKELDLAGAAAELGLKPAEFSERLNQSAVLARILGPLRVLGGTVQRQVFTDAFPELVRELNLGTYLPPATARRR
jgi:hypothetical protein